MNESNALVSSAKKTETSGGDLLKGDSSKPPTQSLKPLLNKKRNSIARINVVYAVSSWDDASSAQSSIAPQRDAKGGGASNGSPKPTCDGPTSWLTSDEDTGPNLTSSASSASEERCT
ncbi:expressed unknown protein [Seminavis robusta]|uniref:Uncharacterized protein n=1 Tax=Seminavis robusta TaxID=568900 RepID=A0A9N8HLR6_9STRA|nr:expressed unknown protein [Seminavis robusta]|eukprot:Sro698_g189320.1 n/a (118) ;mRNA; r:43562-44034